MTEESVERVAHVFRVEKEPVPLTEVFSLWAAVLLVYAPIVMYLTGTLFPFIDFVMGLVIEPFRMLPEALEMLPIVDGGSSTASDAASSDPPSVDELSPGAILILGIIQLLFLLLGLVLFLMLAFAVVVAVGSYLALLAAAPWVAIQTTIQYRKYGRPMSA